MQGPLIPVLWVARAAVFHVQGIWCSPIQWHLGKILIGWSWSEVLESVPALWLLRLDSGHSPCPPTSLFMLHSPPRILWILFLVKLSQNQWTLGQEFWVVHFLWQHNLCLNLRLPLFFTKECALPPLLQEPNPSDPSRFIADDISSLNLFLFLGS